MEQTQKIATKKKVSSRRFWKILFVFAVAFFVFAYNPKQASAGSCYCHVLVEKTDGSGFEYQDKQLGDVATEAECATNCDGNDNSTDYNFVKSDGSSTGMTPVARPGQGSLNNKCVDTDDPLLAPFKLLLVGITKLLSWVLGAVSVLFGWVVKSENVSFIMGNSAIYQSWAMVRDFLNLGFILVLLYIAFCVIFQIGSYSDSWKKMLLMMVIMALLVNFSFPICRVIIDFSNVAFYFLLNNGFGEGMGGDGIMTFITKQTGLQTILDVSCVSVSYLLARIVFTFILAITFVVIAVLFVVRMTAIGLLIIFSPIGFAGAAFPFSKKYASQWWDNLFKYAFFAPVMIFMIMIAYNVLALATRGSFYKIAENNLGTDIGINADFLGTMAYFSIPIVILWFGMHMAQTMSIAGASAVTGTADKFAKWSAKNLTGYNAAKFGIKAGAKKFERDILAKRHLSPRAFLKGWQDRTAEAEKKVMGPAAGYWHDRLNKFFKTGETNYGDLETDRLVSAKMKDIKEISEESAFVNSTMSKLIGTSSPESQATMKAAIRTLYNNNDQDELMDFIKNNLDNKILPGGRSYRDLGFNETNSTVSAENATSAVETLLKHVGITDEEDINKELLDLGNISAMKGSVGFGAVYYDPMANDGKGAFVRAKEQGEQAYWTAAKIMTTGEAQNIPKSMHRNHFTDQAGHLNETGRTLLRQYASPTAIEHISRHKPDFYRSVGANKDISSDMLKYSKELMSGTAKGFDKNTKKYGTLAKDEEQGRMAALWTVSLQKFSGVSDAEITNQLTTAGFNTGEIKDLLDKAQKPKSK